jgi:hypothetical protein
MLFNKPTLPSYELNQYIVALGNDITGCEIGVCHAENFCHMLEACENIKKLIGIDPYIEYDDLNGYVGGEQVQNFKDVTFENLQKINAGDRAEIRIMTSDDAVSTIDDVSLDFIFIDGNHRYEYVDRDVNNYYAKVKVGGIFAGHDYSMSSVSSVLKAFLEVNNIPFENLKLLQNDSWMLFKE